VLITLVYYVRVYVIYPRQDVPYFNRFPRQDVGINGKVASVFKHHTIMTYEGVEVKLHAFFTPALDGEELAASSFSRYKSGEKCPGNRMGRKFLPLTGIDTRTSIPWPSLY
jgi:hypothetical protein